MLIYWNKRKHLHEKRVQLPEDFLGTPTWPPFHCFGTPIWLRDVMWKRSIFNASNHIKINQNIQKSLQEKGQDNVSVSKVLLTAKQQSTVQVHHPSTWIVTSNGFRSRRSWTRSKCARNVLFVVYFKSFIIGLVNNKLERNNSSLNVVS